MTAPFGLVLLTENDIRHSPRSLPENRCQSIVISHFALSIRSYHSFLSLLVNKDKAIQYVSFSDILFGRLHCCRSW